MITPVAGGICAAAGFSAHGLHCGIRKNRDKRDLSLIVSTTDENPSAAAVYTTNLVKGAPLVVTKQNIEDGHARAIICNSGNANTCNADGPQVAQKMCELVACELNISPEDVVVASTGVIGEPLDVAPIAQAIPDLVLGLEASQKASTLAAEGIMTTDTVDKQFAVEFELPGEDGTKVICHIGGIAKGSGMIHPNMATMLVFVTSDVAIEPTLLHDVLLADVQDSFNMVSVDGDTSTNDMVVVLANGAAHNKPIVAQGEALSTFVEALGCVTRHLCREIARDGEGASRLLTCKVFGARDVASARIVAKSIICSSLTKAAIFGADANWGRVLCAIGYSGADVDVNKVDVDFESCEGSIAVCRGGAGVSFDEDAAKQILLQDEIDVVIHLGDGDAQATAWGCDLTYEYVKINGDYRT